MIEKVSPSHPDKVADRIAGAIVDIAYDLQDNPKIAVEVLIGHKLATIIAESSVAIPESEIVGTVLRITGQEDMEVKYIEVPQDEHLAGNQAEEVRCGDNGIFKGVPLTENEKHISSLVRELYRYYPSDGKYILSDDKLIICQSNATNEELETLFSEFKKRKEVIINPLGEWTGGTDVDTGATNRKLGSDMAQSVTGGGLHGKDLSKADVSVNIYAFLKAQKTGKEVNLCCAIGDKYIDENIDGENEIARIPYSEIVKIARKFIQDIGGFEKFAEWGLY